MKIYAVGGQVRDEIMGIKPNDRDYVVVGSSINEMISLGYKQVGSDFPVFLHPETGDEYALARTERKNGSGHQSFDCEWNGVSLEDDLYRRDLTINAIAKDLDSGEIIDPFGGLSDIKNKIIRNVSYAFSEDPLRCLRVVRFHSQLGSEWVIGDGLTSLCEAMAAGGDLLSLTKERVWEEMEKALKSKKPSLFFEFCVNKLCMFDILCEMKDTPQREDHHPEGDVFIHTMMCIDLAAELGRTSEVVFSLLCHDMGKPIAWREYGNAHGHEEAGLPFIRSFCEEWKVPNKYRDLALMVCEYHTKVHGCLGRAEGQDRMKPKSLMKLFEATNAMGKFDRFICFILACEIDAKGRGKGEESIEMYRRLDYKQAYYALDMLNAATNVDSKAISKRLLDSGKSGKVIGMEVRAARIGAIRAAMKKY